MVYKAIVRHIKVDALRIQFSIKENIVCIIYSVILEGAIRNGQFRDTDNIWHARDRTKNDRHYIT